MSFSNQIRGRKAAVMQLMSRILSSTLGIAALENETFPVTRLTLKGVPKYREQNLVPFATVLQGIWVILGQFQIQPGLATLRRTVCLRQLQQ